MIQLQQSQQQTKGWIIIIKGSNVIAIQKLKEKFLSIVLDELPLTFKNGCVIRNDLLLHHIHVIHLRDNYN